MRIGLTSLVFNKQGGISRYVCELAQRLCMENDVTLLTADYGHKIEKLKVFEQRILFSPISAQVATNAWANYKGIKKLKESGVDVVNSQGAEAFNSDVVTMQSCQAAAVKQFGRERGIGYRMLKMFEPRNRVVLAIERKALKDCKSIIAISDTVKRELMENYPLEPDKIEVIHSGVNTDEFNPEKKSAYREMIREKHGLSEWDIVLVFAGWEFKRKGLEYIIRSLPKIKEKVKLLVVGKDDPKRYIELSQRLGVRDSVIFAGHSRNIAEYYGASDIFVFPTAYEPFGLVITEAMASGIPAVTTSSAGAAELIEDGVDGMLLDDPFSPDEIAEKISFIIENNLLLKMGSLAREKTLKNTWDDVVDKTISVYEKTLT